MQWFAVVAFTVSIWALIYWGTLKGLDTQNPKNTFGKALLLGVLYALSTLFPLPGFTVVIAWLLLLTRITMWQYDFDLIPAILATLATIFVPFFGLPYLVRFVGDSELRASLLFYGVPAVTIGGYVVSRIRRFGTEPQPKWAAKGDVEDVAELPVARVETIGKPVLAPIVAPPKYDASAPVGDKPSLLT